MTEARILSYQESDYENMLTAGRKMLEDNHAPKCVKDYAEALQGKLSLEIYNFLCEHANALDTLLARSKVAKHDVFSVSSIKNILSLAKDEWFETPQYLWLRVATQLYAPSLQLVSRCYQELALGLYTPSTPTMINAGTAKPMMASCFLAEMQDDKESIFEIQHRVAEISSLDAAIGVDLSKIRHSKMSNGVMTGGVIPVVQLINDVTRYIQNRRKATATLFLNVWHLDIEAFCAIGLQFGDRDERAYEVNPCVWTYNLFWKRVQEGGRWTLFCPAHVPELLELTGPAFEEAYLRAEENPAIPKKVIDARLFHRNSIAFVLNKTGKPYLMNRDACTVKSNHRHLGMVGSNLCVEIVQHVGPKDAPVCNLSSLCLRKFVLGKADRTNPLSAIDFALLAKTTQHLVENLNRMMERTWYPLPIHRESNERNLAIAIGVSGFADLLAKLDLSFTDEITPRINRAIFACIYYNALLASVQLSCRDGPCPVFDGSPTSQGLLQFDLWREEFLAQGQNDQRVEQDDEPISPTDWGQECYDLDNGYIIGPTWSQLKIAIETFGLRNSLVTALMPTAGAAQLSRSTETVEPAQSNLYSRKGSAGSFTILNRYMVKDLRACGLWNETTLTYLRLSSGSLRGLEEFLHERTIDFDRTELTRLQEKYRTAWEVPQRLLLRLAADRSRYIDQSCSMNIYLEESTVNNIVAAHLTAYQLGLKTMNYYWRTKVVETSKFTVTAGRSKVICTDEVCLACS